MSAYGLTREQNVDMLVRTALEYGITDRRQIAYILATAQHETGDFRTSREDDGRNQAIRNGYRGGEEYYGRGYVQTTHVDRYAAMDSTLGLNGRLNANPDLAATDPRLSAQMTVVGMARGIYTGVGIDQYINGNRTDYTAARAVVNGNDRADLIAGYARNWEQNVQGVIDRVSRDGITPQVMPGSPMNDGVIRRGEIGPEVRRLQEALVRDGATITPDGNFGGGTRTALEDYQRRHDLPVTGTANAALLQTLGVTPQQGQAVPAQQQTPQQPAPAQPVPTEQAPAQPAPAQPAPAQPTPAQQAGSNWPAPGNFTVNRADKAGEGEGEFGTPRAGGRDHKGIDINGRVGDPIESFGPGKVIFSGTMRGYGNTVVIQHDNGLQSLYAHLDSRSVQVDARVTENTVIGRMGRSGNTPGAGDTHLHFEIRENSNGVVLGGTAVDPRDHLTVPGQTRNAPADPMADGVLKHGERGDAVVKLQEALNAAGIRDAEGKPLPTTGYYGDLTQAAVIKYQEQKGLEPDGKAGNDTLTALGLKQAQQPATRSAEPAPQATQDSPAQQQPTQQQPAPQQPAQQSPTQPQPVQQESTQQQPTQQQPTQQQPTQQQPTQQQPTQQQPTQQQPPTSPADQTSPTQAQAQPTQNDKPLMSNPSHPDNRLYQQAVSNLEQLGPSGGFRSREDLEKAAASVAADAKATGLNQIDHISKTSGPNGQSYLVAVQGDPTSPAAKNAYIDYNQATSQTVAQSTAMSDAQKPPAQQPTEQQQETNRVAMGAR